VIAEERANSIRVQSSFESERTSTDAIQRRPEGCCNRSCVQSGAHFSVIVWPIGLEKALVVHAVSVRPSTAYAARSFWPITQRVSVRRQLMRALFQIEPRASAWRECHPGRSWSLRSALSESVMFSEPSSVKPRVSRDPSPLLCLTTIGVGDNQHCARRDRICQFIIGQVV